MKESVYIETSIISYLCSRPSRDLIIAAKQEATREWWENIRNKNDIYISSLVVDEASQGDRCLAIKRKELIAGVPLLPQTENCAKLAYELLNAHAFPEKAVADAHHVAIASVYQVNFLLS